MSYEKGQRVRLTDGRIVTITEVLSTPDAVVAPSTQYNVDVGGGWITRVWPAQMTGVVS